MFGDLGAVKRSVIQTIKSVVTVTKDTPEELPDAKKNKGKVAQCGSSFYICDGEKWVKNAVEDAV